MGTLRVNKKRNPERECRIMVVDDEVGSRESIRMILEDQYEVITADSARKALRLIKGIEQDIDIIFSDIRMEGMGGIKFLQRLKLLDSCPEVIMITAYPDSSNTISALKNGASDYIIKPFSRKEIITAAQNAFARRNEIFENQEKIKKYKESIIRNYEATTNALISTIDAKDHYTFGHSERVARLMEDFARWLNYDDNEVEKIKIVSFLHDIGKIGTPENILNKESPLARKELREMKAHSYRGYKILQPIEFLKKYLKSILYHHERFDGKGYPEAKSGYTIPVVARMLAIVDAYDAITTTRPYRKRLSNQKAIVELRKSAGTQFDPKLLKVFIGMIKAES